MFAMAEVRLRGTSHAFYCQAHALYSGSREETSNVNVAIAFHVGPERRTIAIRLSHIDEFGTLIHSPECSFLFGASFLQSPHRPAHREVQVFCERSRPP